MKKVLVAEDSEEMRSLLVLTLENDDRYELLLATDGEEALSMARAAKPDVLLLDLMMPKMTGFEVCREIKADPDTAGIAVVILSGLAKVSDRERAREAGADHFFIKPFSPTALLDKLEELVSS